MGYQKPVSMLSVVTWNMNHWQNRAPQRLASKLVDCYALNAEEAGAWSWSDRCRVIAEFEL